ncbi:MAG: hypothetical protein AB7V46_07100 [Thermomicrobiales bacterium]
MKRRVCETCFFFETAGLNNSGWCRHPDRQFGQGVRLVVRGNEIACRNGWDADLWVSAEIDASGSIESANGHLAAVETSDQITSIVPARYEPEPPHPGRNHPAEDPVREDIVVGHAPYSGYVAPERDARDLVTNPRAAILRAREQFKSRQKREGRIADLDQHPPLIVDATDDFPASDWDLREDEREDWSDRTGQDAPFLGRDESRSRSRQINAIPPVSREEIRRPFPTITSFAEDADRFESVPDDLFTVSDSSTRDDLQDADSRSGFDVEFVADQEFFGDEPEFVEEIHPVGHRRRESFFERFMRERRERHSDEHLPLAAETVEDDFAFSEKRPDRQYDFEAPYLQEESFRSHEPLATGAGVSQDPPEIAAWSQNDSTMEERRILSAGRISMRTEDRLHLHGARRQAPSTDRATDPEPAAHFREIESDRYREDMIDPRSLHHEHGRERLLARNDGFDTPHRGTALAHVEAPDHGRNADVQEDIALPIDDLPRWDDEHSRYRGAMVAQRQAAAPAFTADVPRMCRTCRDYRPSERPDRGWCNNAWAFTHRRMVDADSLSCGQSTLGSWWTANDGYWQGPADVTRHTQETPLLDRLLASRFDHFESNRRASGSSERS